MPKARGVLAIVICFALLSAPASAAQMDPNAAPATMGPLVDSNDTYEGDSCSVSQLTKATAEVCRFFYTYDAAEETDPDADYGMWWFQIRFDVEKGQCLVQAKTSITPDEGPITASSEKRKRITTKKASIGNKLKGDADGNSTDASLKNRFVLRKGLFVSHFRADTSVMKLRWKGPATNKSIAFAGGYEGAWDAGATPPPFTVKVAPTFKAC